MREERSCQHATVPRCCSRAARYPDLIRPPEADLSGVISPNFHHALPRVQVATERVPRTPYLAPNCFLVRRAVLARNRPRFASPGNSQNCTAGSPQRIPSFVRVSGIRANPNRLYSQVVDLEPARRWVSRLGLRGPQLPGPSERTASPTNKLPATSIEISSTDHEIGYRGFGIRVARRPRGERPWSSARCCDGEAAAGCAHPALLAAESVEGALRRNQRCSRPIFD